MTNTKTIYVIKYNMEVLFLNQAHYNTLLDAKIMAESFIDKGFTERTYIYEISYKGQLHFGIKKPLPPPPKEFIWTPAAHR